MTWNARYTRHIKVKNPGAFYVRNLEDHTRTRWDRRSGSLLHNHGPTARWRHPAKMISLGTYHGEGVRFEHLWRQSSSHPRIVRFIAFELACLNDINLMLSFFHLSNSRYQMRLRLSQHRWKVSIRVRDPTWRLT